MEMNWKEFCYMAVRFEGAFLPGRSNLNLLLVMSSYDLSTLKKYDSIHKRWSKEQVVSLCS